MTTYNPQSLPEILEAHRLGLSEDGEISREEVEAIRKHVLGLLEATDVWLNQCIEMHCPKPGDHAYGDPGCDWVYENGEVSPKNGA